MCGVWRLTDEESDPWVAYTPALCSAIEAAFVLAREGEGAPTRVPVGAGT